VPFVRKAGAVGHRVLRERAPALTALARSPSLRRLCERVVGGALEHRREDDPHASALYVYNTRGDHVGWHYDDCGCHAEASFTIIAGVVDRSRSRLEVEVGRDPARGRTPRGRRDVRSIPTAPGTLAFFTGSRAYHRITPLRAGEERISFSFVYVRPGKHPRGRDLAWQRAIDSLLYFGVGSLLRGG
jgi:hypothetical protein